MNNNRNNRLIELAKGLFWGTIACMLLTLCSCTTTKYVSVPEFHEVIKHTTDTVNTRDSIHVRDSVFYIIKGDTVFANKWQTKYVERIQYISKTDTVCKTDSVSVPVYIEKKESTLHRLTYDVGLLAILLLALIAVVKIIKSKFTI